MPKGGFSARIADTTQTHQADLSEEQDAEPALSQSELDELIALRRKVAELEQELAASSELDRVAGMDEEQMRDAGISPGHALKFSMQMRDQSKVTARSPPASRAADSAEVAGNGTFPPAIDGVVGSRTATPGRIHRAGTGRMFTPGIYRCVHAPRVAIRAEPSKNGAMLDALKLGDLVRIAEIVQPAWGRIAEEEIWARKTMAFPRTPFCTEDASGKVETNDSMFTAAAPKHAYVLIHGAEVGIDRSLLEQLSDEEAAQATWPFSDAVRVHLLETQAVQARCEKNAIGNLRRRFVEAALGYVGTPCKRIYHDPGHRSCLPGSDLYNAPLFLDAAQLVVKVVEDLRLHFGFVLDRATHTTESIFGSLCARLEDPMDMEAGDLIFYEFRSDDENNPSSSLLHLEIFVGRTSSTESVGSMPWNANARTGRRDGVQRFDSYKVDKIEGKHVTNMHFCSLTPWLQSNQMSFAHGQLVRRLQREKLESSGYNQAKW